MTDYWEENGLEKPQRIVVCAALYQRESGHIVTGPRHWDEIMRMSVVRNQCTVKFEEGFVDQFGEFLTRKEALQVVKKNGQPFNAERNGSDTELFSEGLY